MTYLNALTFSIRNNHYILKRFFVISLLKGMFKI